MNVVFSRRARAQFDTAAAWWRVHREGAPLLMEYEVQRALLLLASTPRAGAPGRDPRMKDVRRLVLRETRYLLYYRVVEDKNLVQVLGLWHAGRGRSPKL